MNDTGRGNARIVRNPPGTMSAATLEGLPQRVRDIATLRGFGYSFRQISEQFGITPQAVSLMLSRHRRCLKALRGSIELVALSPRAVNALARHGIRTREQARQMDVVALLAGSRNCGKKTLAEIRQWLDSNTYVEQKAPAGMALA
jgi:predicted transcriptional regulator